FIISFSVRLMYLIELHNKSPFSSYLYLDALRYNNWAQSIAFGVKQIMEPVFRAPLYPLFLAAIYKIFGPNLFIGRFVQMVISALICVLIYYIALKIFSKRIAIISSPIAAFYGPFFYWAGEILILTLIVFLDLIILLILLNAIDKPKKVLWLLGGVVLGLSSIARPNVLIFVPWVIALIFLMNKIKKTKIIMKLRFVYMLCFLTGIFIVILPVTLRNYIAARDFVIISSQGGINFYIGNNPKADGKTAQPPEMVEVHGEFLDNVWLVSVKIAEETTRRSLKPSQISHFWYVKGVKFILKNPLGWFKLMCKKFAYFWTGVEITNNEDIYYFTRFSRTLRLFMWKKALAFPFGIICPIALMGIIISGKCWRRLLLFYGFIFFYMVSVILFFVCARYRLPVIPILLIFAGYTVDFWVKKLKSFEYKPFLYSFVSVLLIGILVNIDISGETNISHAKAHLYGGNAYEKLENYELAVEEYYKVIEFRPKLIQAYHGLGTAYAKMREYDKAEDMLKTVIRMNPYDARAHFNLGTMYIAQNRYTEAVNEYEAAIEIDPNYELAAYWAAVIYEELSMWDEALKKWERVLQINPYNEKVKKRYKMLDRTQTTENPSILRFSEPKGR
ncbi:tetratricopeptide repeat protein, partial [bacterium]|nr:tetratricopeptide repeat protein [bacterium]